MKSQTYQHNDLQRRLGRINRIRICSYTCMRMRRQGHLVPIGQVGPLLTSHRTDRLGMLACRAQQQLTGAGAEEDRFRFACVCREGLGSRVVLI